MRWLGSSAGLDQAQLILTGFAHLSVISCGSGIELCHVSCVLCCVWEGQLTVEGLQ